MLNPAAMNTHVANNAKKKILIVYTSFQLRLASEIVLPYLVLSP